MRVNEGDIFEGYQVNMEPIIPDKLHLVRGALIRYLMCIIVESATHFFLVIQNNLKVVLCKKKCPT